MSSWLDKLPSNEKQKVRERFRMSPAAYEKMRQKVKGPEDLEREQYWNEAMAQLKFSLETEKAVKDALKEQLASDIEHNGLDAVLEDADLPEEIRQQLEQGLFEISVDSPSEDAHDQLVIVPEGNVAENFPVRVSVTESYVSDLQSN